MHNFWPYNRVCCRLSATRVYYMCSQAPKLAYWHSLIILCLVSALRFFSSGSDPFTSQLKMLRPSPSLGKPDVHKIWRFIKRGGGKAFYARCIQCGHAASSLVVRIKLLNLLKVPKETIRTKLLLEFQNGTWGFPIQCKTRLLTTKDHPSKWSY